MQWSVGDAELVEVMDRIFQIHHIGAASPMTLQNQLGALFEAQLSSVARVVTIGHEGVSLDGPVRKSYWQESPRVAVMDQLAVVEISKHLFCLGRRNPEHPAPARPAALQTEH